MNILEQMLGLEMTDEERREGRIGILIQGGVSRADALLVDDIAKKSVDAAFESMTVVLNTMPPHLIMIATIVALRMTEFNAEQAQLAIEAGAVPQSICNCPRCTAERDATPRTVN
jgi:hypothetical protein